MERWHKGHGRNLLWDFGGNSHHVKLGLEFGLRLGGTAVLYLGGCVTRRLFNSKTDNFAISAALVEVCALLNGIYSFQKSTVKLLTLGDCGCRFFFAQPFFFCSGDQIWKALWRNFLVWHRLTLRSLSMCMEVPDVSFSNEKHVWPAFRPQLTNCRLNCG